MGAELRIHLLGRFRVHVDGRELDDDVWRLKKAGHLVKLLALSPNHWLHRDQVMDWLWPDLAPTAAANNLYHVLHVARRTLQPDHMQRDRYIELRDGVLHLAPAVTSWIDTDAFEAATELAMRSNDPALHYDALALYEGDLLPEDRYQPWARAHRDRARERYLELLRVLAHLHSRREEHDLAIECLQQLIAKDPVDEAAHVELMTLYAEIGLWHQALRQFRDLREALRRELDVSPDPASLERYRAIFAGSTLPTASGGPLEAKPEPGSGSQTSGVHNLPAELSSIIGREQELREVRAHLMRSRLVTVTGAGGIGKTRLALAAVHHLTRLFPDGIWFVPLAAIRDPRLILSAIAQALGIREIEDEDLLDTILDYLAERRLLLVVDNLEHLAAGGSTLTNLLSRCGALRILVTSRIRLRLEGEQEYPIEPLQLPGPDMDIAPPDLSAFAAPALFIQRSRENRPDFEVTPENVQAIVEICWKLDGLPLAIELAAARSAVLTPGALAERLDKPLSILTGGSMDRPSRQKTVRDTIAWSYDLLGMSEQTLLQQFGVFTGGWTLEAAEAVVGAVDGKGNEVIDGLTVLVDHSLVRTEEISSRFRYSMLETIREFVLEQMTDEDLLDRMCVAHASYFLDFAEQAEPALLGPESADWLDRIEAELANIRAALEWSAHDAGDAAIGLRLVGALWVFWDMRGLLSEGRRWIEAIIPRAPGRSRAQAKAHFALGYLATRQGDRAAARPSLEKGLAIYREIGHRPGESRTLAMLGALASFEGDFEQSTPLLEKALAVFRDTGDRLGTARTLLDLGDQLRIEGDYRRARLLLTESLDLFRELEVPRGAGWALTNLGNTARAEDDLQSARLLQDESRALFAQLRDKRGLARPTLYLANLARLDGDLEKARALYRESLNLLRELRDQWRLPVWLYSVGLLAHQTGYHSEGVRLIIAAGTSYYSIETLLDPAECAEGKVAFSTAHAELGADGFAADWSTGESLSVETAIELALETLGAS